MLFPTTIAGSLPKPEWLAEPNTLWAPWRSKGDELARANPEFSARELYAAATRVGRAHIASVINTIVLAYAGASLPLLVLIVALDDPVRDILTDQLVATELVRSAVGTMGLIAAVPLTTAAAAFLARGPRSGLTRA